MQLPTIAADQVFALQVPKTEVIIILSSDDDADA
jgi:hypothetical protein